MSTRTREVHVAGEPLVHGQYCSRCGKEMISAIPFIEGRAVSRDGPVFKPMFWAVGEYIASSPGGPEYITHDEPTCSEVQQHD